MQTPLCSRLVLVLAAAVVLPAQEPPERVRNICDKADPRNRCAPPGLDCTCVPDTLEIVFDGKDDSVLVLDHTPGQKFEVTVIMDVKSRPETPGVSDVQGWSYGVLHDVGVLTILDASTKGTDAEALRDTSLIFPDDGASIDVVTCATNDARCPDPTPGGGFISAVVLSLRKPVELPSGKRSSIARARYETTGKVFAQTAIQFTDRLAARGSPPAALNITIAGNSRLPENVVDGLVFVEGEFEDCGNALDDDADGLADCADADCCLDPRCILCSCDDHAFYFGPEPGLGLFAVEGSSFPITLRTARKAIGFQLGVKATRAGNQTRWSFSSHLGADASRLVDLLIADGEHAPRVPTVSNQASSSANEVTGIERGAAIAGFAARDFLSVDLNPGVGGPGFTVGYVADVDPPGPGGNLIPATAMETPCPVNEVLRVSLGVIEGGFHRGDADGSGRLNVADAVLIIQVRAGGLPERIDCDDARDANDDGTLNMTDAVHLLHHLFQRGPPLPAPSGACGQDPTQDALACTQRSC